MLAGCGDSNDSPTQQAVQKFVGQDFSHIEVQTLDGQPQPFKDAAMDGKPVVMNVWATWCAPCVVEMPKLAELGKQGKYTVVAIATDADAKDVKEYLKKQSWGQGVQIWFDKLGGVTRDKMGAGAIPVTYVMDKHMKVRMVEAGERDWVHPTMESKMEEALR